MTETQERAAEGYLSRNMRLKRNKYIFFALNLLLIVPYVVDHGSRWGCLGAAAILLVMLAWTVFLPEIDQPASRNLPVFGFLDLCILLGLSYQELIDYFDPGWINPIIERAKDRLLPGGVALGAAAVAMVADIALRNDSRAVWIGGLGRTVAGAALIRTIWDSGALSRLQFFSGVDAFLAFYVLCAMGWCILCAAAYYVDQKTAGRNACLSWLLLAAFSALCLTEVPLVRGFAATLEEWFLAVPSVSLSWWRTLAAMVVLVGGAIAAYDYDHHKMGVDSLVLGALASGVLLLRILLSRYSAFNCLIFLIFLAGCFRCLYNERRQFKTLRLPSAAYLAVQLAALALAVQMLKNGLWVLLILICVYAVVFYATAGKDGTFAYRLCHWLTVLSCPAVLAVGYIWQMCFVRETCVMIGTAYVVLACFIAVLSWPHPDGQRCPDSYKWAICALMTLLCLMAIPRYGSNIQVTFNEEDNTAVIALEARGEDNRITSAAFSWSDPAGKAVSGGGSLSAGETTIPIEGRRLTVVATDAFGAATTIWDWYPEWLLERNQSP